MKIHIMNTHVQLYPFGIYGNYCRHTDRGPMMATVSMYYLINLILNLKLIFTSNYFQIIWFLPLNCIE